MTRFAYILLTILLISTSPLQVQAVQDNYPLLQLAQNNQQGLNAAVQQIKKQTGGRILSAKTINKKGRAVHHIKVLLPSGKVRVFKVNQ